MNSKVAYIPTAISLRDVPLLIITCEEQGEVVMLSRQLWKQLPSTSKRVEGRKRLYLSKRSQDWLRGIEHLQVKLVPERVCIKVIQQQKEALRNTSIRVDLSDAD